MEHGLEERYAIGALFTLALHETAGPGLDASSSRVTPWGQPACLEDGVYPSALALLSHEWDAFWGWDLVAPGGLCDRVYTQLGIPRTKWPGLKCLPLLAGCSARVPLGVVRSFVQVLDPELAASLPPPALTPRRQASAPSSGEIGNEAPADEPLQQHVSMAGSSSRCMSLGWPASILASCSAPGAMTPQQCSSFEPPSALQGAAPQDGGGVSSPAVTVSSSTGATPLAERREVRDDLWQGLLSSSDDSDWEEDMRRVHAASSPRAARAEAAAVSPRDALANGSSLAEAHQEELWQPPSTQQPEEGSAALCALSLADSLADAAGQESLESAAAPASSPRHRRPPTPVSPHALGALLELLQYCVGAAALPLPELAAGAEAGSPVAGPNGAQRGAGSAHKQSGQQGAGCGSDGEGVAAGEQAEGAACQRAPQLQWYDARARVALKQVAAWLQVPWRQVANFEYLLANEKAPSAEQAAAAPSAAADKAGPTLWEQRVRWAKVGAAAVGGGALFALTGGLAAPALAAGLGSVLTALGVGGSTAVVGTTGFLASTGGVVTVATTLGAAGAASTGNKMSYRTAGVTEFGFRELPAAGAAGSANGGLPAGAAVVGPAVAGSSTDSQPPAAAPAVPAAVGEPTAAAPGSEGGEAAAAVAAVQPGEECTLPAAAAQGDSGHLLSSSPTKPARVGRGPPSRSQLPAASSSGRLSSSAAGEAGGSGGTAAPPERASSTPALETAPSTWQRWFGRKPEEAPLLPVPLRVRGAGDVKLSALICISGWIADPATDYVAPWEGLRAPDADAYCLVWESRELLALNSVLGKLLAKQAASQGAQLAVHSFFFAGAALLSAVAPALLLDTATGLLIENAWAVALERAQKAGKLLAHVLMGGGSGGRPVTLVAHSIGARLVFHCLLELCRHNCRGIVQDVVLFGAPVSTREERWAMARRVVVGRLVNCFSRRDWLLAVVFAGSSGWVKAAAGLCPVEVPGIENVNLSGVVAGHFEYLEAGRMGEVLESMALLGSGVG